MNRKTKALSTLFVAFFAVVLFVISMPMANACPVSARENPDALVNQIAKYLRDDLKLAQSITVEKQGQEYIVKNRGCYICHGKMVKETYGIKPACAMSMFPVGALSESLKIRNVRLKEIRKPGPTGDCDGSSKSQTDSQPLYFWNDADPKGL